MTELKEKNAILLKRAGELEAANTDLRNQLREVEGIGLSPLEGLGKHVEAMEQIDKNRYEAFRRGGMPELPADMVALVKMVVHGKRLDKDEIRRQLKYGPSTEPQIVRTDLGDGMIRYDVPAELMTGERSAEIGPEIAKPDYLRDPVKAVPAVKNPFYDERELPE